MRSGPRRRSALPVVLVAVAAALVGCSGPSSHHSAPPESTPTLGPNLLVNGEFSSGLAAWRASGAAVSRRRGGHHDGKAARVAVPPTGTAFLGQRTDALAAPDHPRLRARIWVRADRPGLAVTLRVREIAGKRILAQLEQHYRSHDTDWHLVQLAAVERRPESSWGVSAVVGAGPTGSFTFDDAELAIDGRRGATIGGSRRVPQQPVSAGSTSPSTARRSA